MAGVEGQHLAPRYRVAEIELMRADGVALAADAEKLALHGVADNSRVQRFTINGIQRLQQALAWPCAVDGCVLHAVRNPEIRDAGRRQRTAECRADAAGCDAVIDPEVANGLVAVRQREVVGRARMREERWIEIEADVAIARPVDPGLEVLGSDRVAIDVLAAKLAI